MVSDSLSHHFPSSICLMLFTVVFSMTCVWMPSCALLTIPQVMLHQFAFGTLPPLIIQSRLYWEQGDSIPIPNHPNDSLRSLLAQLLKYEPEERISMAQVCVHPFFLTSIHHSSSSSKWRIQRFRMQINSAANRSPQSVKFQIKLRRSSLVNDVIEQFEKATTVQLLSSTRVKFEGEEAIDAGGVTANLYTEVTKHSILPSHP